jgi:hypothetical protein
MNQPSSATATSEMRLADSEQYRETSRYTVPAKHPTHSNKYGYLQRGAAISASTLSDRAPLHGFGESRAASHHEVTDQLNTGDPAESGCRWGCCRNTATTWTFRCSDGSETPGLR